MRRKIGKISGILVSVAFLFSCRNTDLDLSDRETINRHSSTVSKEDAKIIAYNFFSRQEASPRAYIASIDVPKFEPDEIDEIQTLGNKDGLPILYTINLKNEKGFVVMSASNLEKPILAYGSSGKDELGL